MESILLYTDDNLIGQSIQRYMIDNDKNITALSYQNIMQGEALPQAKIVIFNVIHKDISAADTVHLLNKLRFCLARCVRLVLIVRSDIAGLFRELIFLENLIILTEKSSLNDFSDITNVPTAAADYRFLLTHKKLSVREIQVLELIMASYNNKRIAAVLHIDHKTVHSHRIHIMKKLGMDSSRIMNKKIVTMYQC
ncbi:MULTISPECIES: helix-turn-helix transcriptional regulator [Raoultella]|uniref:helix-turn-helix domain-containing protein n=1 Tax=Raoultella TaxID=160674 RepID=UPI000977ED51|nr:MULTISPECIES: helix-turn-helix transcriptional regulator [Raoultella]OMP94824.1 helix-turn-helix transcriptional regulator [Raoultella terrigena]